jgi:hypothetical protein
MITVKTLLSEAKKPVAGHVIHLLTNPQVTGKEVDNLENSISQPGKKHIYHTSDIKPETKAFYQGAMSNHKHFFAKDGEVKTVFDAVDKVKGDKKPITVMTHPNQVDALTASFKTTHPDENIKVKPLLHDKEAPIKDKKQLALIHPSVPREQAKKMIGEALEVGDFVTNGLVEGEIINIHPRYAVIVENGNEHRVWIEQLDFIEGEANQNRIYKESYKYRGYKSKNLTRELAEEFRELSKSTEDVYALLNCLKSCDFIMGSTSDSIQEDFKNTRIQLERAKRYTSKFGINISEKLEFVEENCLQHAIIEGVAFTTTDKNMIAKLIASVADESPTGIDPTAIINKAVQKLRLAQLTPPGWKIVGRMLAVATKAGIRWNKDTFSKSQLEMMGL